MLRLSRLQTRLILAFVLILLIPTVVITGYGSVTAGNRLLDTARSNALQLSQRVASSVTDFLDHAKSDTLFLNRAGGTSNYADVVASHDTNSARTAISTMQTIFIYFAQNVPHYDQVQFVDATGQEIVHVTSSDGQPVIVSRARLLNVADQDYFKKASTLAAGDVYISSVSLSADKGQVQKPYKPIIRLSTPVYTSLGNFSGAVVLTVKIDPLADVVNSHVQGQALYLLDSDGTYLVGPDASQLFGRDLGTGTSFAKDFPNDAQQVLTQSSGTLLGSPDRPDTLQAFAHIPGLGWTIYYAQASSDIFGDISNTQMVSLGLGLLALLISVVVAVFISRVITRPITALTQSAIAISEGDLAQSVPLNAPGEIGVLSRAFNVMVEKLAASYATLEKRVEERTAQLAEAQRRAEQASKAKSIFLSNMSHELRTPLNVIIGYTSSMLFMPQMYENAPLPTIYRNDIQLIMDNGQYLVGLINDILDLSKIEEGRLQLHKTTVNLYDTFQGVIATAVGLVKDKDIQIRSDYSKDLPLVLADPMRVRQVILNLMSNAAKFTERGSITLSARAENGVVKVSVADTGIGIPEKALEHIFDRFMQAGQDTDRNYGGTGLGLDISKQLSRMHGGDLTVQSTVGQGSTFSFTLPVSTELELKPAEAPQPSGNVVTLFEPQVTTTAASLMVLLVIDDAAMRNTLHETLENAGHIVVDVFDATQALDTAIGMLPNIILLDQQLTSADSHAVLQDLRSAPDTAAIPVIVLSDGPTAPDTLSIQKPVTPEKLLENLQQTTLQKDN